jgi:DNA repair protein RAD5
MFECTLFTEKIHRFNSLGGILADEMGLGKTITSISLILEKPYVYKPNNENESFKFETKNINDYNYLVSKATLILCPSHLTKQWSHEIEKANKNLNQVLILTKTNHEKYTYQDILNSDVVIISFQFLFNINYYANYANLIDPNKYSRRTKSWLSSTRDVNNRNKHIKELINSWNKDNINTKNAVFESIFWHRIIIDEAHEMFTESYQFENVFLQTVLKQLQCHNKWYVSGTPFYNTKTLVNVMDFLEFNAKVSFCDLNYDLDLDKSMKYGLSEGNILNSIFKQIYIRNTKESVKDQLTIPPANIENILLEFSDFENVLYESLKSNNSQDYLRKICCNIQISDKFGATNEILNFNEVREKLIKDNQDKINKTELSIKNLDVSVPGFEARKKMLENIISSCQFILNCFNSEIKVSDDSCPICRCEFDDPVVTTCGHNFCYDCINEVLNMSSYKKECPICRTGISNAQIFKLESKEPENKEQVDELVYQYGTKLAKLIKLCKQILLDKTSKIIIFSEWDRLLTMIGTILKNNEIYNVFCKGNVHQRNAAIAAFRKDSVKKKKNSSRVIMLSTEHAASGTNLTDATHIIFMESHIGTYGNVKAMEDQAIGRAVRLGQENQVNVYRLIMKNTIEEDIFNKYLEGKDNVIEKQFQNKNNLEVDI